MKMKPMRDVRYIVVHCSATLPWQDWTVEDVDRCHRGKGWTMVGYHWIIRQNGEIQEGRPEEYAGAHVVGYNEHAIGVCYIGGLDEQGRETDTRTPEQKAALWYLLKELKGDYPNAEILGHCDFPGVTKKCPCFDVKAEVSELNSKTSKFY